MGVIDIVHTQLWGEGVKKDRKWVDVLCTQSLTDKILQSELNDRRITFTFSWANIVHDEEGTIHMSSSLYCCGERSK